MFLDCRIWDALPVVRRGFPFALLEGRQVGQSIEGRTPHVGATPPARLGDHDEAEYNKLVDRSRNRLSADTGALEVVVGDGQATIVASAMVQVFELEPQERAERIVGQCSPCW